MTGLQAAGIPTISQAGGARQRDRHAEAVYWGMPGREPSVEEMVHDPIVQLVMRRDCVSVAQIMATVAGARARLRTGVPGAASG